MKRLLVTGVTAAALAVTPALATSATADPTRASDAAPADTNGTYLPVTPARITDTRPTGKVAAGDSITVQVTGRGGVPSTGVSAVVANLTVTGATKPGYLSAYPSGGEFPGTSALNFAAGETRANLVTVPVGSNGAITVLNGAGTGAGPANVIVDVQGYYLDGTATTTATPALYQGGFGFRLLDTRIDGAGALGPRASLTTGLTDFDDPDGDQGPIVAYALNVTAVAPTAPGYLVAWDGVSPTFPTTSVLNFAKGRTTPNNVVVPAAPVVEGGETVYQFAIGNGSTAGKVDVLVDIVGIYVESSFGEAFRALPKPVRVVDSRVSKGLAKLGPNQFRRATPPNTVLDPDGLTGDLVGNLTAVRPSAATYLTVYPDFGEDDFRPEVSNLNPAKGQTVANHAYVSLGDRNRFNVYNSAGSTDVLLDVTGYFIYLFEDCDEEECCDEDGCEEPLARAQRERRSARDAILSRRVVHEVRR